MVKILPSEINVNLIKTTFTGRTIIDGEKYYIGKNGKLTNAKQTKFLELDICLTNAMNVNCFLFNKILYKFSFDITTTKDYINITF